MTYQPIPTKTEDQEVKVRSSNDRLLELATAINAKLAIIIHHLSMLTKEDVTEDDLEDK